MSVLVGLDIGTSSAKAVALDLGGHEVAVARRPFQWQATAAGGEVGPQALLEAGRSALNEVLAKLPEVSVLGLGVASMGESGVLLNRSGEPVAPVIAWHDTRDLRQVAELQQLVSPDKFARRTGLPLRSQWSLTKHRWLTSSDHQVSVARRLNVAEWVIRELGGEEASEQSLASRTGWLDLTARDWWQEALEWSGLPLAALPPLVTAGTPLGAVAADAGIPQLRGAVLTAAGHDHQAAAVGAGAYYLGDELDSCGTAEALVRTVPPDLNTEAILRLTRAGITIGWHAAADRWCLLGGTRAGLSLHTVLDRLGLGPEDVPALEADPDPAGPSGVAVTVGENVMISGLTQVTSPIAVWRAALDAVTDEARTVHDAMTAVAGPPRRLLVTGGWSHSRSLLTTKRRAFGPLTAAAVLEAGARGAALFAGLAAGCYRSMADLPAPELAEAER